MKSIDELDHYELLEIARSASSNEVDRAYRLAQQTYAEGSLALYSVFESLDAAAIRNRIDEAYRVLSDPELRGVYDESLESVDAYAESSNQPPFDAIARVVSQIDEVSEGPLRESNADEIVEEFDALEDDGSGEYDGVRLRRTRLFRGFELEDITEVTKVSGNHLRNIEEENFYDLPADVYVRGFVTAYAKTIGLDPTVVVPGYMERVVQAREEGRRGRFLGRG